MKKAVPSPDAIGSREGLIEILRQRSSERVCHVERRERRCLVVDKDRHLRNSHPVCLACRAAHEETLKAEAEVKVEELTPEEAQEQVEVIKELNGESCEYCETRGRICTCHLRAREEGYASHVSESMEEAIDYLEGLFEPEC